ncbi:hypothetical protein D3C75_1264800 [compost metagenome]
MDTLIRLERIRLQNGGQQRLRIRMKRIVIQLIAPGYFNQTPAVHHADPVGNMPDHRQVMGNEQIGQSELRLQILQHIDHLCLDGHVER